MDALSFMHQVSNAVFTYSPDSQATGTAEPSTPKLIVLLGWVAARDVHLAKYVLQYRQMYPSAYVLLVRSEVATMALPSVARGGAAHAVAVIRDVLNDKHTVLKGTECELLIHLFSNGGIRLLAALTDAYGSTSTPAKSNIEKNTLPRHVTIIDSAPAPYFDYHKNIYSILQGLPSTFVRTLLSPVIHLICLFWLFQIKILRRPDSISVWSTSLNDRTKNCEIRRTYVYSDVDPIIKVQWVERHADEAQAQGFTVRRELFAGSLHVAHARPDPERYWRIVRQTWSGKLDRGGVEAWRREDVVGPPGAL